MTTTNGPPQRSRERNVRGQGDRLREEVLEALVRLVSDDARMAPLPVSLREVAREAGVTAPAIYRHFATKEELGEAAVADGFARLLAAGFQKPAGRSGISWPSWQPAGCPASVVDRRRPGAAGQHDHERSVITGSVRRRPH